MTIASYIVMGLGVGFVIIGSIGILRFRDIHSRLQAE